MLPSQDLLQQAALALASIEGLHMDPKSLVEDTYLLGYAFPDEQEFMVAVSATVHALSALIRHQVDPTPLRHNLAGWSSYHYQHRVAQGARADCRIIFRELKDGIEVKAFGHRRIPRDLYQHIAGTR